MNDRTIDRTRALGGDCRCWPLSAECPCKVARMRRAIRGCLQRGLLKPHDRKGTGMRLAEFYGVSRQRIYQLVREERGRRAV